jgi:hypothetical protein
MRTDDDDDVDVADEGNTTLAAMRAATNPLGIKGAGVAR